MAGGEPRADLRDRHGGGVPEQLRCRPVPLRRGEALLLLVLFCRSSRGGILLLVDVGMICKLAKLWEVGANR